MNFVKHDCAFVCNAVWWLPVLRQGLQHCTQSYNAANSLMKCAKQLLMKCAKQLHAYPSTVDHLPFFSSDVKSRLSLSYRRYRWESNTRLCAHWTDSVEMLLKHIRKKRLKGRYAYSMAFLVRCSWWLVRQFILISRDSVWPPTKSEPCRRQQYVNLLDRSPQTLLLSNASSYRVLWAGTAASIHRRSLPFSATFLDGWLAGWLVGGRAVWLLPERPLLTSL